MSPELTLEQVKRELRSIADGIERAKERKRVFDAEYRAELARLRRAREAYLARRRDLIRK